MVRVSLPRLGIKVILEYLEGDVFTEDWTEKEIDAIHTSIDRLNTALEKGRNTK